MCSWGTEHSSVCCVKLPRHCWQCCPNCPDRSPVSRTQEEGTKKQAGKGKCPESFSSPRRERNGSDLGHCYAGTPERRVHVRAGAPLIATASWVEVLPVAAPDHCWSTPLTASVLTSYSAMENTAMTAEQQGPRLQQARTCSNATATEIKERSCLPSEGFE